MYILEQKMHSKHLQLVLTLWIIFDKQYIQDYSLIHRTNVLILSVGN